MSASSTNQVAHSYEVRLSTDMLSLKVTLPDPHADLQGNATRIAAELPALELAVEIGEDIILGLLEQSCQPGEDLVEFPLLTGNLPEPPRDGTVEWQGDFFAAGFSVDEDHDTVDYWDRAENRAVKKDQLLAVLLLPLEGTPGMTLQGNEVSVPKPKAERLRAGKGIRTEEQEDRVNYYADVAGRLSSKDGNVGVEDVYSIRGDVDIEVGNIHHTGTLHIQGDVKEGATIECDGDVMIKGMVEPANIICGGDLVIGGGVVGDEEHRIQVGGTMQARYLNDVTLRCAGDLTIISQIDHSTVETLGGICVSKGRIAGGNITAYRGVRVGHAGAAGATGTTFIIGANYEMEERQIARRATMIKLQAARDKIAASISQVLAAGAMDDARRKVVANLEAKMKQVDTALHAEAEKQNHEAEESIRGAVREVAVLEQLWSGVTFKIGASMAVSDRSYDKPRLVALRRDKVRVLPMGELNTPD